MFEGCKKLKKLNLLNFSLNNIKDNKELKDMFKNVKGCKLMCNDKRLLDIFNKSNS